MNAVALCWCLKQPQPKHGFVVYSQAMLFETTCGSRCLIKYLLFSSIPATNLLQYEMFHFVIILHAGQHILRETNDLSGNYLSWEFKNLSQNEYCQFYRETLLLFPEVFLETSFTLVFTSVPSRFLLPGILRIKRYLRLPYKTCRRVESLWSGSWNPRMTTPGSPQKC